MAETHTLKTPDGTLYYEVRGSGPAVVLTGAPMDAGPFEALADLLATERTVITHDPRGIGRSPLDDPAQDSTPELRADDLVALLDAVGVERADLLGSSGGAVTTLAAATRHPGRFGTIVAHEPPLLELLPNAVEQRASTEEIIATYHRDGIMAAFGAFMVNAGFPLPEEGEGQAPPEQEPGEQESADAHRFFAHELRGTTRHVPDVEALREGPARVVVGLGVESAILLTDRTSRALAKALGVEPVMFPGGHGGFEDDPRGFAEVLRRVLS
ncbi:alpha/beta fold hydrolase [Nocardiopsis lambiniae]|uniref:Alpha/beta hydrolase n=1 Tax=Nocardiopsis lambiniae TaxID=3075539 RepID=A0ABU2M600_9ACTN|nr:alpha/beta hydrolase [Nocardiopsis sp. DSM 44743]MDT0327671.1 alpha/beta hydrolase [Nocardiopsis sp. DSM 44743]